MAKEEKYQVVIKAMRISKNGLHEDIAISIADLARLIKEVGKGGVYVQSKSENKTSKE